MRCRNQHTAAIDGVEPGQVGDFNPDVVRGLLRAGKLVPVEGDLGRAGYPELPAVPFAVTVDDAGPTRADAVAMLRELDRRAARIEELVANNRSAFDEIAAKDARITELEVELAQLKLDLEAATDPAKVEG